MITKIIPLKIENKELIIKLSIEDVELLRCWISWTKDDLESGHHNYTTELRSLINELEEVVSKFQYPETGEEE